MLTRGRPSYPVLLAVVSGTALVLLSLFVATSVVQHLDVAARGYFRPHDEWGPTQMRADMVVEGAKPRNVAPLLALVGVASSVRMRSWRPAAYAAAIGLGTAVLTVLVKLMLQRTDPHSDMSTFGGSFPSGHMVSLLVCLGGAILVLRERSRWWEWGVVALAGSVMAWALLVQATHWATDVLGGVLIALTVLGAVSVLPLRRPERESRWARPGREGGRQSATTFR